MSLLGSMFTGVSGLSGQAQRLATISENIANVNTVGYKRIENQFQTFVTETNPRRHSPGGVVTSINHQLTAQGTLQATTATTDMAISGTGFFVVNQNAVPTVGDEYLYTRAGKFAPDATGDLKNTAGYYLQGWPLDVNGNLPTTAGSVISLETVNVGQLTGKPIATSKVDIGINLPAKSALDPLGNGTVSDAKRSSDIVVFDSLGIAQTIRLNWNHVANNTWHLTMNPGSYGTPPVLNTIVDVQDATGVAINTVNGAAPANQLGNPLVAGTQYLQVVFNTDGTLRDITDPSTGTTVYNNTDKTVKVNFDFSPSGATNNQTISFNFGRQNLGPLANVAEGLTQYDADYFTAFINQNGVRFGSFTGVNINEKGVVTAIFDNGQTQPLYQIPLVSFANPNGLQPVTGNAYSQTERAGEFILREAGKGGTGTVVASTVETSTVDIAEEFSNMIVTQRAYSANTRVISTASDMLNELIQIAGR
ncbi:MAG: flagellar hook protein FlgE [Alphaproteobacteria bacterium]|nr:flagellar hook protein FlgE [Alphaproteobacteria bacterium]